MAGITSEIKVGIFVICGLLLLIYMTATVGNWSFGRDKGYLISVKLDSAAGVLKDTPVKVLGVTKGRVESLEIAGNKALVTLRLPADLKLPEDSLVYLRSEGLLGERYIEVKPGTDGRPSVSNGGELLQGAPPADLDQLFAELSTVAAGITNLTRIITRPGGAGLGEGQEQGGLQLIISNLEEASRSLKNVAQSLERGEGTLGKLLTDETVYDGLNKTLADVGRAVETISGNQGTLVKLLRDDEIYRDLKEAIDRINGIIKKTEKGEGVLGKLLLDNRQYGNATAQQEGTPETSPEADSSVPLATMGTVLGKITE